MNRTLDSMTTDTILSKKDKKPKKDKKRRKAKKDKTKKKKAAGITININVGGGGGGKAKQPKQPRGAKGLVARTTSMRGQRGKGNIDQAARQAEANARAMQGIYGVSTRITETDRRVDDMGDRLNRLGQYFYTNQPAQIQQPPDQKFNVTMNLPDVGRLGTQMQDNFGRLEEGLQGAFVEIHNQNMQTQTLAQNVLDGVNGANEVADLFDEEFMTLAPTTSATLEVEDDPDKTQLTPLGTEPTTIPTLGDFADKQKAKSPTSSSIFVEDGDEEKKEEEKKKKKKKKKKVVTKTKDVEMKEVTEAEAEAETAKVRIRTEEQKAKAVKRRKKLKNKRFQDQIIII